MLKEPLYHGTTEHSHSTALQLSLFLIIGSDILYSLQCLESLVDSNRTLSYTAEPAEEHAWRSCVGRHSTKSHVSGITDYKSFEDNNSSKDEKKK